VRTGGSRKEEVCCEAQGSHLQRHGSVGSLRCRERTGQHRLQEQEGLGGREVGVGLGVQTGNTKEVQQGPDLRKEEQKKDQATMEIKQRKKKRENTYKSIKYGRN